MKKNSQSHSALSIQSFGGMDPNGSHTSGATARDVVNFRITENGCLKKREGFRKVFSLHSPIRASYTTGKRIYVLTGSELYAVSLTDGRESYVGQVLSDSGNAFFVARANFLYLFDSKTVYEVHPDSVIPISGYAPLVGKDWPDTAVGTFCAPRNVLTRKGRISYLIKSETSIFLYAGAPIDSVDAVFVNDVRAADDEFYFDDHFGTINVLAPMHTGDHVMVYVTFSESFPEDDAFRDRMLRCTGGQCLEEEDGTLRFFCWKDGDPDGAVFFSSKIPLEDREYSHRVYPSGSEICFIRDSVFSIGSHDCSVTTSAIHHRDLMLFTPEDAWRLSVDSSGGSASPTSVIHPSVGAANALCATLTKNDPVTFDGHSLWLWGEPDEDMTRRVHRLSSPVDELIAREEPDFGLFYNRFEDELMLYNRQSGNVYVRNMQTGHWSRFEGIYAQKFFEGANAPGFITKEGDVCFFDPTIGCDYPDGETARPIVGQYVSGTLEREEGRARKLSQITLSADHYGDEIYLTLTENGRFLAYETMGGEHAPHTVTKRMRSPRFRRGELQLTASGNNRTVLHRMELTFI